MSTEQKRTFFQTTIAFVNTLESHFGMREQPLVFKINKEIVDVIIGDMLFDPDDFGTVSQERAIGIFTKPNVQEDGLIELQFELLYNL
jgi:hypothetical protein